jgi:hypothetical protein
MKKIIFSKAVARAREIREIYHRLERKHHGSEWTVEEDALAFLTDAGLVGRLTMDRRGRWPVEKPAEHELEHKLGECMWWLMVLAERMGIDAEGALEGFLTKTEGELQGAVQLSPSRPRAKGRSKEKGRAKKRTG